MPETTSNAAISLDAEDILRSLKFAIAREEEEGDLPPSGGHLTADPGRGRQKVVDYGDEGLFA